MTTLTIQDAFELPSRNDILAMRFVVKLAELERGSAEVQQLVDDCVVTPAVSAELPKILSDLRQVVSRGEEYGRFIHGSFGSGKSHFMTMLSLLLEGDPAALTKFRPFFWGRNSRGRGRRRGVARYLAPSGGAYTHAVGARTGHGPRPGDL